MKVNFDEFKKDYLYRINYDDQEGFSWTSVVQFQDIQKATPEKGYLEVDVYNFIEFFAEFNDGNKTEEGEYIPDVGFEDENEFIVKELGPIEDYPELFI